MTAYADVRVKLGPRSRRAARAARCEAEDAAAQVAAYRGPDRRGILHEDRATGTGFAIAATSTIVLLVAALVLAARYPGWMIDDGTLAAHLGSGALALTLPLAVLFFLRWQLVGEAPVLWLGVAAAVHGVTASPIGDAIAASAWPTPGTWTSLAAAAKLVTVALVLIALRSPDVDAALRPVRIAAAASVVTLALTGLLPPVVDVLRAVPVPLGSPWVSAAALATTWLALAYLAVAAGRRTGRSLFAWFGLAFLAFAGSELFTPAPGPPGSVAHLAPPALHLIGLLWAAVGATDGLIRAYHHQAHRLLTSLAAELTAEARIDAEHAANRERAHEARNAMAAIQMATLALRLDGADLPLDRGVLFDSVAAELRRLAILVDPPTVRQEVGPFHVSDAILGLPVSAGDRSMAVSFDIPDRLVALGRPEQLTQVLHNLLQNARRYGGGAATVHARRDGSSVVIRVDDDGPGVPECDRATIFDRGVRGSNAAGTAGEGLGLHIARRLMLDQGGDLRLEARAGRGARFTVTLPAAFGLPEEVVDEGQEPREVFALRR